MSRLEGVRQRAGTGPVVWLLQPLDARLSAFAFGWPRRRFVAISGGAAVAAVRKPAAFDAVILHELAHIKNRDIDQTYLALAIWRAFVVAALLPLAVLLIFTRVLSEPQQLIWRVAVTALIVYSLRNAILRSREFDADARARQLDPGTALGTVLAGLPARTGRRTCHLGWTHPSGQERAAALLDPAPLYRFGFWDGLAVGLVAALGASAALEILALLTTTVGVRYVVTAIIFAAFAGPAVAVAMWRRQLVEADPGVVKGWAARPGTGSRPGARPGHCLVGRVHPGARAGSSEPGGRWRPRGVDRPCHRDLHALPGLGRALGRRLATACRCEAVARSCPGRHGRCGGRRVGGHGRWPVPSAGDFHPPL